MINESRLKKVSIGLVARDILEDDMYVDIYPIELQPNNDGSLTESDDYRNTITDSQGNITMVNAVMSNLIKAKWLPYGDTNRLEPPTVCRGETVMLYRYGDTDEYYWTTPYNQLALRKLEKRTIVVSNKQSIEIPTEDLLKYSYYLTMDSINKVVQLHTSTTDGEFTEYDITIDTKEGLLEITDGQDNRILLDSRAGKWVTDSNEDVVTNTKRITNNGSAGITENTNHKQTNTKTFSVSNGDELIGILSDLIDANIADVGIGNLGSPVSKDGNTIAAYQAIKTRLRTYIP